jgi:hypothetical protein
MKKILVLLSFLMVVLFAKAQNTEYQNDEIQTIFSKRRSNGGYGAFTINYSNIGGQNALVTGGRGGFIFDHSFAIGLGGYGFFNNIEYNDMDDFRNQNLGGGYGGLLLEPIIAGRSPFHVAFPVLIGMGGITHTDNRGWYGGWGSSDSFLYGEDAFFVIEPAIDLEFNMTRFFRLAATASYRFTSKIDLFNTDEYVLNGFNFGLTFKFGKF